MSKSKKKPKPMDPERAEKLTQEINDRLDQLKRAKDARAEFVRLQRIWETSKIATKEAKEAADDAASRMAAALDDTPMPLFDQAPGWQSWRLASLDEIELPKKIRAALEGEGLVTAGDISDYAIENINGIGLAAGVAIDNALKELRARYSGGPPEGVTSVEFSGPTKGIVEVPADVLSDADERLGIVDELSPAQQAAGLPIERLDLPEKIRDIIDAEGLATVGELVDHIEKYDDATSIKGIGPKAAEIIDLAIAQVQRLFEEETEAE